MWDEVEYDDRHRMTLWRAGDEIIARATYDGPRLLKWEQTASEARTFNYDARGRLVGAIGQTTGPSSDYTYDDRGNVIQIRDSGLGGSRLEYDASNRLIRVTIADRGTVEYSYDERGRVTRATRDGTPDLAFVYDATGLLVQRTSAALGAESYDLEYDAQRHPVMVVRIHMDSVTGKGIVESWRFEYDCR
jgi:YD repeat-containing protein